MILPSARFGLFSCAGSMLRLVEHFCSSATSDDLRRLSERAQKSSAHTIRVTKARFLCDRVDRMSALLYHKPC